MLGYNQTVTVYHKTESGDTSTWTPAVISGVYSEPARAISAASQAEAAAPAVLVDFPVGVFPEQLTAGDYIVIGACSVAEFTGSAPKTLLPVGGRKVERIAQYVFDTELDHVEVTIR